MCAAIQPHTSATDMKNHIHPQHRHAAGADFEPADPERYSAARRCTWVSISVNLLLTLLQLVIGYFGRSQALMADGLHSLSDLLSDFLVLFANRESSRHADARHPYGHARIETAATLLLGAGLTALGVTLLFAAVMRLQEPQSVETVHVMTLWVALLTLVGKEALFRYLMAVAKRVRSQMLEANAWHSRSDAASSLVVVLGIGGNLLGYTYLDLVAAAAVAVMIARMGAKLAFEAMAELIDTGLDDEEVAAIRRTLRDTPGVRSLHELRTRKMADNALVDAHIVVDPRISVSEGHYIAEAARQAVLSKHHVLDVMVHIDPEDDRQVKPNAHLPDRASLLDLLASRLGEPALRDCQVTFHYLDGRVEAEIQLPAGQVLGRQADVLQQRCDELVGREAMFRSIHVHLDHAQD